METTFIKAKAVKAINHMTIPILASNTKEYNLRLQIIFTNFIPFTSLLIEAKIQAFLKFAHHYYFSSNNLNPQRCFLHFTFRLHYLD